MKLWTIRNEQLAALQVAYERQLCERAVAYVRRHYPQVCAALEERSIRASVETALQKRVQYRFDIDRWREPRTEKLIACTIDDAIDRIRRSLGDQSLRHVSE